MMKRLWLYMLLSAFWLSGRAAGVEHTRDPLEKIKERVLAKKAVLLDVREQREWDEGHLKAAKLAPLSKLSSKRERPKLLEKIDRDKIVYCHCKSGGRVLKAAEYLEQLGYDVRPMKWGFEDLVKAGFAVATVEDQKSQAPDDGEPNGSAATESGAK